MKNNSFFYRQLKLPVLFTLVVMSIIDKINASRFFLRHPTLKQVLTFLLVGCITGLIDLLVYSLCYYFIFPSLRDVEFHFIFINYSLNAGGKCAFLSFAFSYGISQCFNFIAQRKATFKANNNPILSGFFYFIMVILIYAFCLWFPSVISEFIYEKIGISFGAIVVKLLCQTACTVIQFPINKFFIMRKV